MCILWAGKKFDNQSESGQTKSQAIYTSFEAHLVDVSQLSTIKNIFLSIYVAQSRNRQEVFLVEFFDNLKVNLCAKFQHKGTAESTD